MQSGSSQAAYAYNGNEQGGESELDKVVMVGSTDPAEVNSYRGIDQNE